MSDWKLQPRFTGYGYKEESISLLEKSEDTGASLRHGQPAEADINQRRGERL